VELMVLPSHRRRRIATRLMELLLARADAALATTRVEQTNSVAQSVYRAWGWTKSGEFPSRDGSPALEAWSRRLTG
jgi:GNAT superfamily N-acetyltransferase